MAVKLFLVLAATLLVTVVTATTMDVTCDDYMTVFFDEDPQPDPNGKANSWNARSTYNVPDGTKTVGISCRDREKGEQQGRYGVLAEFDNGMVSDVSWMCAPAIIGRMYPAEEVYGEHDHAVSGMPQDAKWIWTAPGQNGKADAEVYCHIKLGSSSVPTTSLDITCDDYMRVFFDGVKQADPNGRANSWDVRSTYAIPDGTKTIGVMCRDRERGQQQGRYGVLAAFDNGMVSDESWSCASVQFGPAEPAEVVDGKDDRVHGISTDAQWIWTTAQPQADGAAEEVFCYTYM